MKILKRRNDGFSLQKVIPPLPPTLMHWKLTVAAMLGMDDRSKELTLGVYRLPIIESIGKHTIDHGSSLSLDFFL